MSLLPEDGIPNIDTSSYGELTTDKIRSVIAEQRAGDRLTAVTAKRFVETDFEARRPPARKIGTAVTATLLASHITAETAVKLDGGTIPTFGTLPQVVDTALRATYNLYPIGNNTVVESAALRDHVPMMLLGGALGYTAVEVMRNYVANRRLRGRAKSAQDQIKEALKTGTLRWRITEGSSVAFVGHGDPLASELASRRPGDTHQISYSEIDGPWTYLPKEGDWDATMDALDRANIDDAGEILFFPIKRKHEFLPGDGDHDISVGRIVDYITAADQFCNEKKKQDKRVLVIGRKEQYESYQTVTPSKDLSEGIMSGVSYRTLAQQLEIVAETRTSKIEIIDPTDIIMDKIVELADGRPLTLAGTHESMELYGDRFVTSLRERKHTWREDAEPLRILYNDNDLPTVNRATKDDIVVILDPGQKNALTYQGIPEERIIVVADEVLKVAAPKLDQA